MTPPPETEPANPHGTTGHEWDGIRELNTPLPRWWLYLFYMSIIFALAYVVLYPALPGLARATAGTLGWTSRGALAGELAAVRADRAQTTARLASLPIEAVRRDPALARFAVEGGRAAFKVNCVQCHGSGAAGGPGFPNLNDDDWLWGGDLAAIEATLRHGIRDMGDDETRQSAMPAFGRDGILQPAEITAVTEHVLALGGRAHDAAKARAGAALFEENCAACHGPDGRGNREFGAPNLSDGIWLYGGDRASVTASISAARAGMMPAWGARLDPATIRSLALYVHSLGGGE